MFIRHLNEWNFLSNLVTLNILSIINIKFKVIKDPIVNIVSKADIVNPHKALFMMETMFILVELSTQIAIA